MTKGERVDLIIQRYEEGKSLREIAAEVGLCYEWTRKLALMFDVPLRPRGGSRLHRTVEPLQ